jgi:long-chain acyl-CoA synthetase
MEKIWLKNYQPSVPATIEDQMEKYHSIADVVEESFTKYPQTPAFTCMGKSLSYGEVDVLSRKFASYLQNDLGLKKGDRVAIMLPNILQYPVALFGILRAGMVVVNVNPLYTPRELEHQLKDSGSKAIIIYNGACHTLEKVLDKTEVKHVLVTTIGEMLGFPKALIVDFVIKRVKKMVPAWHIASAKNFSKELNQFINYVFKIM